MRALEPIFAGEEVLNDYGPLPRSDLLRRYGYTTADYAAYDVTELQQSLIIAEVQKFRRLDEADLAARLEYLDDKDALEDGYILERRSDTPAAAVSLDHASNDTTIPADLRLLLQTLLSQPDEYRKLRTLPDLRLAALFLDTCRVFAQVLRARAAQYATSADADAALLRDASVTGRRRAAVEVRLAEKQILHEALQGPETIVAHFSRSVAPAADAGRDEAPKKRRRMA